MTLITGDINSVLLRLSTITDAGFLCISDGGIGPLLFLRIASTRAETEELAT